MNSRSVMPTEAASRMTRWSRRRFLSTSIGAATLPMLWRSTSAHAQDRGGVTRIICGYPAGGVLDVISRKLADRMTGLYAKSVIVDTRTGAAGRIAVEELKKSPADGSVMLVTPASVLTMYPHVYRQLSYDPSRDLLPLTTVAATDFALSIGPQVPESVRSVADFARWARDHRALASCGNAGAGSMPHFMALILAREIDADLTHVPFRGGAAALQAVAGGQCAAAITTEGATISLGLAGRLRVLATTGEQRSRFLPQAPTFAEAGHPKMTQREWFGAFLPSGASPDVVAKAGDALREAVRHADVRESWDKMGLESTTVSPAELRAMMRRESEFWGPVVRESGFTPEA